MSESRPKQKFTWIQGLWAAAGLSLLGSAILTLVKWQSELVELSTPLGLVMLTTGGINIFIYRRRHKTIHGSHWLLADGMSTALLSVFLLFNQMIYSALIPFFFGVWELFSGILKVIDSRELREERTHGWYWFSGVGTVEILSGIAALLKPVDDFVGMHGVVAIVLIIQSCGYLFKILIYPHLTIENKDKTSSKETSYEHM